jgi:hypothetical protein
VHPERVRVRELSNDEGRRLLRIVRRDSGSVVGWRPALLCFCRLRAWTWPGSSEVAFTSPDRVREVIRNFNDDGSTHSTPRPPAGARRSSRSGAPADQEDGGKPTDGARLAVVDLEPVEADRVAGRRQGWSTTSALRAFALCSAKRACRSTHQDLETEQRC